jgi:hypothetical protein
MVVQVRPLGHAPKKRFEVKRIRARGIVRVRRALFARSPRRGSFFVRGLSGNNPRNEQEKCSANRSDQRNP